MARFPGRDKAQCRRDNFMEPQRWLRSQELETMLIMLESFGMEHFGFGRSEAREIALESVKIAKKEFDRKNASGSPDAGRIKQ